MSPSIIHRLVQSAFQTGYLSVESEGLIRQVMAVRSCEATDLSVLEELHKAVYAGQVKREARESVSFFSLPQK